MARTSIDYGIDLGTTNSCIAVWKGTDVEVIKNGPFDYTPSAVWIRPSGGLELGLSAYQRSEHDPDDVATEFKPQMGWPTERVFKSSRRRMKPEELSAEVLKALVGAARLRYGEAVEAAVITVPAAFDATQTAATTRAAQLAGLKFSPLLMEPVAAALSFGLKSDSDKVYWLVFDLGGGTFDAALVRMQDGVFVVANHGGDPQCGGKYMDWEVVNRVLIPQLLRQYSLPNFHRDNEDWRRAFAKLKWEAEQAKIKLSTAHSADILVEFPDHKGKEVRFEYQLQRSELEQVIESYIVRSINVCKKVLAEKNLSASNVERALLIGGPTLIPRLQERLADKTHGLGIPSDKSQDPMTAVAGGAAIFAAGQLIRKPDAGRPRDQRQFAIELDYKPAGSETEPPVKGTVDPPSGQQVEGLELQFSNIDKRPPWRSSKYRLAAHGKFLVTIVAEPNKPNTYRIELTDSKGRKLPTTPDSFPYTHIPIEAGAQVLVHKVGISEAGNTVDWLFQKGDTLPKRGRSTHRTTVAVRRGQQEDFVRIPLVEGEKERADRNRLIGYLKIPSNEIKRDLPAESDVEITVEVDESRNYRCQAYVPVLDQTFDRIELRLCREEVDLAQLREDFQREKERLQQMRRKAQGLEETNALQALNRIEGERMIQDIEDALAASRVDKDMHAKCQNRLLDLQATVDEIEDALKWPLLVAEAEGQLDQIRQLTLSGRDRLTAAALERETREAISVRNPDQLRRKTEELKRLQAVSHWNSLEWQVALLPQLEQLRHEMKDPTLADQLYARGRQAMQSNDLPGLQAANQQLISLLEPKVQKKVAKDIRDGDTRRHERA